MDDKYYFFWSGPFSQWYKSYFVVDGIEFNCAEQYMMFKKAQLFGDIESERKIMLSKDPKEQKKLGRNVLRFIQSVWDNNCREIVYKGNYAKFSQNENLRQILFDTNPKILVEASPYDKIWGIGLDEKTAKNTDFNKWPGKNLLGKCLMVIRRDLSIIY